MKPIIGMICAVDNNFGIAKNGKIPWHIKEEFQHFKKITHNSILIMGKNTYLDMLSYNYSQFMPNRDCVVITSSLLPSKPNVIFKKDITSGIKHAQTFYKNIFFIGGVSIFNEGFNYCDMILLSKIHNNYNCDIFFPKDNMLNNYHLIKTTEYNQYNVELYTRNIWKLV